MNIVVVTWIGNGNYGTSLQSFALCHYLQCCGYNVSIMSGMPRHFGIVGVAKSLLMRLGINYVSLLRYFRRRRFSNKQKKLYDFISNNYNVVRPINSSRELDSLINHTDVFITGSDQIWNTVHSFDTFYFLDFAREKKRIAYASSMGIEDFPEEHKDKVRQLLSRFKHIGVREQSAACAISRLLGRDDICQVLDPTFLIEAEQWGKICAKAAIEFDLPKPYMLCYLIGNNTWYAGQVESVRKALGIENVIIVPAEENPDFCVDGGHVYKDAGPLEFVQLIREAAVVCTDSFHATAISINLQKKFVEFMRFKDGDTRSQNSRIYDLLGHYGLRSRIFDPHSNDWQTDIDYCSVSRTLANDRKESIAYLTNAIER